MSKSPVTLIIAGGEETVPRGLRSLLEREEQIAIIGEADDGRDAARLLKAMSVQVVILSLTPPNPYDIEIVRTILRARQTRLILLTLSPPIDYVQELLAAGAKACLTKECAGSELLLAIEKVIAGGIYLSPSLVERVVSRYVSPSLKQPSERALAPREREVLRMIAAGTSVKEIAAMMCISVKTVETHRSRIMHKLERHTVADLTKYAVIKGLSSLENPV